MILCELCDLPAERMLMTGPPSGRAFLCEDHANENGSIFKPRRPENERLRACSTETAVREMREQNVATGLLDRERADYLNSIRSF